MKNIKKNFLILAFLSIAPVALLYGVSPQWYASTFLGVEALDMNIGHLLRVAMGQYIALSLFWLYAAFNPAYRNAALLTTMLFIAGTLSGRIISLFVDGLPQPLLIGYFVLEAMILPVIYWVLKSPEQSDD